MICSKEKCTGCFACYNICPKKCIKMEEDELGFIYPKIDTKKCVKCGACKKVCPQLTEVKQTKPIAAYAMYNKKPQIRSESTSGGAAATLYSHMIKNGGIVYGCSNIENNEVKFIRVTSEKDLYKLKKSKYVHAYIYDIYTKVKKDLIENKKVLFIGTPCQIAGLKAFLRKEYEELYLVDIICHGVPSQKLLFDDIKRHSEKKVTNVLFREGTKYKMIINMEDGKKIEEELYENPYLYGFMNGINLRLNCYECKYATDKRLSDITIGDFWGLSENSKLYNEKENGISLIMPVTEKGQKILEEIIKNVIIEERPLEEAIMGNTQLKRPSLKHKKSNAFREKYGKVSYEKAAKTYMFGVKLKGIIKSKLKQNKVVYNIYKIIKNK